MKHSKITLILAVLVVFCGPTPSFAATDWQVTSSMGMDALVFIGALSGDLMAEERNQADVDEVRGQFSPEGLQALSELDQLIRVEGKGLVGPRLTLYFSAGAASTLDDLRATINNPQSIQPAFAASPYWNEEGWAAFLLSLPLVNQILEELARIGFEDKWNREILPQSELRRPVFEQAVTPYDIIPEQERLLGRHLDPAVEIIVLNYNQPYGIKIIGQRFLTHHSWPAETQLRIAAHEIFHPPYDLEDQELKILLEPLANDTWLQNIIKDHDPRFGYNTFEGVINEDSTQALDQIVSERLGFARDPAKRFTHADGGMHMMAAAFYHAMKLDGFDERGGTYSDWLKSALRHGLLSPELVRNHARAVVGDAAVDKWDY